MTRNMASSSSSSGHIPSAATADDFEARMPTPSAGQASQALFAVADALEEEMAQPTPGSHLTLALRAGEEVAGTLYVEHAGQLLTLHVLYTGDPNRIAVSCYGPGEFHIVRRALVERMRAEQAAAWQRPARTRAAVQPTARRIG